MSDSANRSCAAAAAVSGPLRRLVRLTGACALAAGLALPVVAHANCHVDMLELPVKMVGSRAVATVGINGTSVPLTVDSGAYFSVLTDAAAAQFNLRTRSSDRLRVEGLTGKVDAQITTVRNLQLLGGDIPKMEFIVGGNEPGAGTMGLMGRNMLAFTDTEYDLAHGAIRFFFPNDDCAHANMAYWAGSTPVTEIDMISDFQTRTPAIRAWVKLNGSEATALFDTGAITVVSARAAKRIGIAKADMTPAGTVHGLGRGSAEAWTASFDKFELGGEAISHNTLHVADFDLDNADMLLGIDFFLSHRIYISKSQAKMFVTYSGGKVFALDRSEAAGAVGPGAGPATGDALAAGDTPATGEAPATTADQLARRGAASAARSDYDSALADLNRACELEPTSAALLAQRGAIQAAMKRPAKALEDFDRALELDPTQAGARVQRARLRFATKNRDGAKADLDALDKALAPQAQVRLLMAHLYLEIEQPAQALVQLNQWLPAHPNEVGRGSALNSRCWARAKLGIELDRALDDCNDAVDSDEKNPSYLDSRGWVYLRLGRYDKALSDFDRSIEYRHENPWSLYGRGLVRKRRGDAAQSDGDLAAARKLQADIDVLVTRAGLTSEPAPKP